MQNPQFCLTRRHPRRRLARLLVLLPRSLLALGGAEVAGFAPGARFRCGGLADVATSNISSSSESDFFFINRFLLDLVVAFFSG